MLIIGGSGFIGTHLIDKISKDKYDIVNFDKKESSSFPETTIIGDIRDLNHLKQVTKNIDLIIHLAAEHEDNIQPKSLYYDVNVKGTQNIVDACIINNVNRIIFTSSVAVYGLDLADAHEDSKPNPFNDYGKSKLQAEQILTNWWERKNGRSLSIIRPTVVFGERNRGNVFNLMKQVAVERFIMVGNGQNTKSIAYVGNLVEFISCSIRNTSFSIINYADKPDLSMNQLIALVYRFLGKKEKIIFIPYWLGVSTGYFFDLLSFILRRKFTISSFRIKKFCSNSVINTDKLKELNFRSTSSLFSAIERTIKYEFGDKLSD